MAWPKLRNKSSGPLMTASNRSGAAHDGAQSHGGASQDASGSAHGPAEPVPDAPAAWPGRVEGEAAAVEPAGNEVAGAEVAGAEVAAAEPESTDLPLWDWSPPGESVPPDDPEDEPTAQAHPPKVEWKLVVTPVEEVKGAAGTQPPGIGQRRGNLAHLAAHPRMRVWQLRVVVAVLIMVAFWILVSWQFGLTLAVIAIIADTIYRSRRASSAQGRATGAQRRTRRQLAKLVNPDGSEGNSALRKPKNAYSESLRRQLADFRLEAAQVEIARHPAIALDLLTFHIASRLLDQRPARDGLEVELSRKRVKAAEQEQPTAARQTFTARAQSLAGDWREPDSEAARFEAFRSLPEATRLELLAYCVALTLKPKLAPSGGDEFTAYDAALALTGGDVSAYWRPGKDSFLGRVNRDQLLAVARDTLGETWAQSRAADKKAKLVEQLDRAFADPAKYGKMPEQFEKLKTWLPAGMAFGPIPTPKPVKSKKARKAA